MRINTDRNTMDIEARDTNYFFQAYLLNYLFVSKGADPVKVIFPKFPGFPHPRKPGVIIPVEYVEVDSPVAEEIVKDGSNIPAAEMPVPKEVVEKPVEEVSAESPAKAAIKKLKKEDRPAAKKQSVNRQPKMPPSGDLGSGHPDGMSSRDIRFEKQVAKDLRPEAAVDESKEIETEIEKPKE